MTLSSIIVLLQMSLSFLISAQGTPLEPQARDMANQAVVIAQLYLAESSQAVAPAPETATNPPQNAIIEPTPAPVTTAQPTPMSKAKIEVISPIGGKGLGRAFKMATSTKPFDESNYIELGLVVYNDSGENIKDATVNISATDASQNKTLVGTGNMKKILVDGALVPVFYYPFHYEFQQAGEHTITFACNGLTQTVTLQVE